MHTDRGFPCDTAWMNAAIKNHKNYKDGGHLPTIIIGHNVAGKEKEAVGFLDKLVLRGNRLYANLTRVPKGIKEKILRNAFPSRSVEILPKSKRILTLALLGGTTPHFALPQMAYAEAESNDETHLWFRSPEMEMTEEFKKELYENVAEVVNAAIPDAVTKFLGADGDDAGGEPVMITDPVTGEQYAIPAALAAKLMKGAKGAAGFVKKHPAAAAGSAGVAAGRASKRKYATEGYTVDEETGEVYLDGEALGVIVTYEDMAEVGMKVPAAVKKPDKLPTVTGAEPTHKISSADVGPGSGEVAAGQTAPGAIAGTTVQPLDRDESEQFEDAIVTELYNLRQEVGQLTTANELISQGRRAEAYAKWLKEQQTGGVPVGNVEKTVEFMMTLSPEQAESHKQLLLAQPKVAFEKAEQTVIFEHTEKSAVAIKEDYKQNKDIYRAMGVSDDDLKWAGYVRVNQGVGEIQP